MKVLSAVKLLPEAVKLDDPAAVNTGASFIAFTVIVKLPVPASSPPFSRKPLSVTTTLTVADPLAFGAGVKVN